MIIKKKYVIIFIIVCVLIGIGSFEIGTYMSKKNKSTPPTATTKTNTTATDTTAKNNTTESKNKLSIFESKSEQLWEKTQEMAKQEGTTAEEATNGGTYTVKEVIRLSKNFYMSVEKSNKTTYINGQIYIVLDISLLNVTSKEYYSDLSNFTLQDETGYTFQPDPGYPVTGSIIGTIQGSKGMRYGQIAFLVQNALQQNNNDFTLTFNASGLPENSYNIKSINFKISFPNN
jgi:hypothetical protein